MAIGTIRCFAIDVEDLEVGASFWSELTGIPRISSPWPDRFAYLGHEDETTWQHQVILHRVATAKRSDPDAVDVARRIDPAANRAHMDIGVDDIDGAIAQIERIGGRLKYPPTLYPVPHDYAGARPLIDLGGHAGSVRKRVLPRSRTHRRRTRGARRSRRAWTRRRRSLACRRARRPTDRVSRARSTAWENSCRSWWSAGRIGTNRGRATIAVSCPPHVVELLPGGHSID